MAYQYLTMLDLAKINAGDAAFGLIEENLDQSPEAKILPARTIKGTTFTTLVRTGLPTTQFRAVNEGVEPTKSSYDNKISQTHYLDGQMEMDVAAAQADEQGQDHALTIEADGHAQAAIQKIGAQVWYGSGALGDAKGFPGAVQIVDPAYVLDAGGTTAGTGSSVFGLRVGEKYVSLIFGKDTVLDVGEWRKQTITRAAKEMTAWKNSLEGWIGVQWNDKNSVCQLKDATADSGKTVTDAKLAELLSQLKWTPNYWFMNRRSLFQLQTSRTPTSNTSGEASKTPFAPVPESALGIPIIVTDRIVSTETLS